MIYRFKKNISNPKLHTEAVFDVYLKAAYVILSNVKDQTKNSKIRRHWNLASTSCNIRAYRQIPFQQPHRPFWPCLNDI